MIKKIILATVLLSSFPLTLIGAEESTQRARKHKKRKKAKKIKKTQEAIGKQRAEAIEFMRVRKLASVNLFYAAFAEQYTLKKNISRAKAYEEMKEKGTYKKLEELFLAGKIDFPKTKRLEAINEERNNILDQLKAATRLIEIDLNSIDKRKALEEKFSEQCRELDLLESEKKVIVDGIRCLIDE